MYLFLFTLFCHQMQSRVGNTQPFSLRAAFCSYYHFHYHHYHHCHHRYFYYFYLFITLYSLCSTYIRTYCTHVLDSDMPQNYKRYAQR